MGVLEHHQHRPAARFGFQLIEERLEQLLPFPLRVFTGEPGGAFEVGNEGIERAFLVVRRAEVPQPGMRLASDLLGKRRGEPRLADARLAGDQHHPSFAVLPLLPEASQQLDFLVTPDKRRFPRAQRLEPAQHPALANDPPRGLRLGKPGKRLRPKIGEIEQPADLPARRLSDDERVRHGHGLQPGGEVRRLADNATLLCRTLANQVANYGEPGGDAEPHAQILVRRQFANRLDHRQPGAHRPLGIVLMRLRVAEIDQHAVAHIYLSTKPSKRPTVSATARW
jgi:hypothetical protein